VPMSRLRDGVSDGDDDHGEDEAHPGTEQHHVQRHRYSGVCWVSAGQQGDADGIRSTAPITG